jgi:hypothetical protein
MWSPEAEELMMGTAAKESELGLYLHQLGAGPALGIWQVEPATHEDNWSSWLDYRPDVARRVLQLAATDDGRPDRRPAAEEMVWNLRYCCAQARIRFRRAPGAIPKTLEGQAEYWDRVYNANPLKGTPAEYVAAYNRLVKGR